MNWSVLASLVFAVSIPVWAVNDIGLNGDRVAPPQLIARAGDREMIKTPHENGGNTESTEWHKDAEDPLNMSDDVAMAIFINEALLNLREQNEVAQEMPSRFKERIVGMLGGIFSGRLTNKHFKSLEWGVELESNMQQVLMSLDLKDNCSEILSAIPNAHICAFHPNAEKDYEPPYITCDDHQYREQQSGIGVKTVRDFLKVIDERRAIRKVANDFVLGMQRAIKKSCSDNYRICNKRHVDGVMVFQCDDKIYRFHGRVHDGERGRESIDTGIPATVDPSQGPEKVLRN